MIKKVFTALSFWSVGILLSVFCFAGSAFAQVPEISYITPDAGAKGMTISVEFIGPRDKFGNFGEDKLYEPGEKVRLLNESDSNYVVLGPSIVSWNGRLVQCMLLIREEATDRFIPLVVANGTDVSQQINFAIVPPQPIGVRTGGGVIAGGIGVRTSRGTMVVDSLILRNGAYNVSTGDIDVVTPGNQGFLPLRILSKGPIRLESATINVNGSDGANNASGGSGGVGGGGGGGGAISAGGAGFTGGGAVAVKVDNNPKGGTGSGAANPNYFNGGFSLNGTRGGDGVEFVGVSNDEGGGGGTGHPFGDGGYSGVYGADSREGRFGAGSGAGQANSSNSSNPTFGGGGAGYATAGQKGGGGNGDNGGKVTGNPMIMPLAGGSGGGSGNVYYDVLRKANSGCGGGGGGAVELTSFATFSSPSGNITAKGGNGSAGSTGFLHNASGAGGGSGGAIVVSARDSIVIGTSSSAPSFVVDGGNGGAKGGGNSNAGGAGGQGRVRIDGRVSKLAGNTATGNFFNSTRDYNGVAVTEITGDKQSFVIHGYGRGWDGANSGTELTIYYKYPSTGWRLVTTTTATATDPNSFTASWVTSSLPRPTNPQDSVVFVVALQNNANGQTTTEFTREPNYVMTHTSGFIGKIGLPKIAVQDSIIDFGNIRLGTCSADSILKILSVGNALLRVDTAEFVSGDKDLFTIKRLDSLRIPQGKFEALGVNFCPKDTGCFEARVQFSSNDTIKEVILRGCGVVGKLLLPDTLNFGDVVVGTCKDSNLLVRNTGKDTVFITQAPNFGGDFSFVAGQLPIVIPPDSAKVLTFRFCPSDEVTRTTTDQITPEQPVQPKKLTLIGRGVKGVLTTPSAIDFGCVVLDSVLRDTVVFRNPGTSAVTNVSTKIVGSNDVVIERDLQGSIAANGSDSIIIRFTAATLGDVNAKIVVTSSSSTIEVPITAHVSPKPTLIILDQPLDFGEVNVGDSATLCVRILNPSCKPITIAQILPPPFLDGFFSVDQVPPKTLADSVILNLCITFKPFDTITIASMFSIVTDDGKITTIDVNAKGVAPILAAEPDTLNFGKVLLFTTSPSQKAWVINRGTAPTSVKDPILAGPNAGDFSFTASSSTVPKKDSISYYVAFTPQSLGPKTAYLVFTFGTKKDTVVLIGEGVSKAIEVILYADTIITSPGKIIRVPIKTRTDMSQGGVQQITYSVAFDPMLLDLRTVDLRNSIVTNGSVSTTRPSLGEVVTTITSPNVFKGIGTLAEMEMEVLYANDLRSPIFISNVTFGGAAATLSNAQSGEVRVVVCDTTEKFSFVTPAVTITQINPNPFNGVTRVHLNVNVPGEVKMTVRNSIGQEVLEPVSKMVDIGAYSIPLDATTLPTGTYTYIIEWRGEGAQPIREVRRMIVVK